MRIDIICAVMFVLLFFGGLTLAIKMVETERKEVRAICNSRDMSMVYIKNNYICIDSNSKMYWPNPVEDKRL